MFCVYKHTSPNGKVYVGITCQNPVVRWSQGYKHNSHFTSAILKYGWDNFKHEVLFSDLTKEEAETKEIELIAEYKSNNPEFGYNIENGGNAHGKHSEQTKRKISDSHKGMKYDESFCAKVSVLKKRNKYRLGKTFSEESKQKISDANKGKFSGSNNYFFGKRFVGNDNPRSKLICKYSLDGEFIEKKESANQFATEMKKKNASHIVACCKGKRKSAYGFVWRYADEGGDLIGTV